MINGLVSIVIPVYNSGKYLEEAIKSCLNQTYSNIEIITVIHDSTDNSLEILKKYSEKIRIIEKQNMTNAYSAVNLGIKEMKGEWFKFMGADDVLYPYSIEELVFETKKFQDLTKIIFYSNFDYINSKSEVIATKKERDVSHISQFDQNVLLLEKIYGNINSGIIHKSVFDKYGFFNEKYDLTADYEFVLRLCLKYGFHMHLISKNLLKYRMHRDSESHKWKERIINEDKVSKKNILESLDTITQKKYEIAWKKHRRTKSKIIKNSINFILKKLPLPLERKITKISHRITKKPFVD